MWDFIEGTFERYIITTDGDIYDLYTHKEIIGYNSKQGYVYVNIYINGESKTRAKHRLVCQTFLSNPENKPQVNHKDANKQNNKLPNLEWCTAQENMDHVSEHELHPSNVKCCTVGSKGEITRVFKSIHRMRRLLGLTYNIVYSCCIGTSNDHEGVRFRFYDENSKSYIKTKFDDLNYEYNSTHRQKILCIETGQIFKSQSEASRVLGIRQPLISQNLNKGKKCKYNFKRIK